MTKAELAAFKRSIEGMTPHNRAWILNRDVAKLLTAIDEKDVLIADALALLESGWSHVNWMIKTRLEYDEKLAALKAGAEK